MTTKPPSLSRTKILAFGLALYAAGLFTPIYQIAESVWGKEETAQIFSWILSAKEKQEAVEANQQPPPVVVTPEPPVVVNDSEAFFRSLKWLRTDVNGANAKVTKQLKSVRVVSRDRMTMDAEPLNGWANRGDLYGVIAMAVNRGGRWEGGKFDQVRISTKDRDFKNICGYLAVCPQSGEAVRFWLISYDGRQASNYLETRWP